VTTVLITIRAIAEKIDVINAIGPRGAIGAIDLIGVTNAKKKFAENALEQIAKKYVAYPYAILVNQTTKKRETINVYS
jgi:hypothetical protein